MSTTVQLTGGAFQDAEGNVIANGFLLFELSQDAQVNGTSEICSAIKVKYILDASGNVQTTPPQYIWPNDVLTPSGTYYKVTGYKANGQRVWGPSYQQVLSTPNPYNIGNWPPNTPNTGSTSAITYDIGVFFPGQYTSNQVVLLLPLERIVRFAANFSPSRAAVGTNPTANTTFTINQNGTQIGTLTVATTGVCTFSCPSGAVFNAGDVLTILAPSSGDPTLANLGILLSGTVGG